MDQNWDGNDKLVLSELTRHQPDLQAFVRVLMPGDPSVDDVVQQTNLVVWNKRSVFIPGSDFRAWIFAIARLEVLSHRKQSGRKSWLVIDEALANQLSDSMCAVISEKPSDALREALMDCIRRLKPAERKVIERFYFTDEKLKSIASADRRSEGALKVSLHRIRAGLRRCIEGQNRQAIGDAP